MFLICSYKKRQFRTPWSSSMPRPRYIPRSFYDTPTELFDDAEQAWFWFIRCQKAREEGARFEALPGSSARPCDPDDLYRAVTDLSRRRRINDEHLRILESLGYRSDHPIPGAVTRRGRRDSGTRPWTA